MSAFRREKLKFSVLLCVYNSRPEAVVYTLDSIMSQKTDGLQVVVCDDGSADPRRQFYTDYFAAHGFKDYTLSFLEKNGGTVRNMIAGLKVSAGKYVKPIGPGDALADENVLDTVYNAMEAGHSRIAYGPMRVFTLDGTNRVFHDEIRVPTMGDLYAKPERLSQAKRCMVSYGDNISGAQMFLEREYFLELLERTVKTVVYTEDIGLYLSVLDGERLTYIATPVILYEAGSGITTSGNSRFMELLIKDRKCFIEYLKQEYPDEKCVKLLKKFDAIDDTAGSRLEKLIRKTLADPKWLSFRSKLAAHPNLQSL